MKWQSIKARTAPAAADSRYVPRGLDDALSPRPAPAASPPVRASADPQGPSCLLVSADSQLAARCAGIALGAAVRLAQCGPQEAIEADPGTPVLWGADAAAAAVDSARRADVLIGTEEQAAALWSAASALPLARVAILPGAQGWLGEYLGLQGMRAGHGHTLAVGSAAGGIGASTLCFLLAHAGTLCGLRSVLIDLDPHSSGLWQRICAAPPAGAGWEALRGSGGSLAAHQLRAALPQVCGTSVVTWEQSSAGGQLEQQLIARLLSAARQGFDFLVLDTGRAGHPQAQAIDHFVDRGITLCQQPGTAAGDYVLCGQERRPRTAGEPGCLGSFSYSTRISRAAARGQLVDCFKSRSLRQQLADLQLIPQPAQDARSAA
ncbi:hypothetical protein AUR04nite_08430 [Glutamicibacter uratoxydans]|uniref:Septum formation initiator n=1 Tax=Glutamicibacter uratoxydans TaxID=43667 RepID=A0A4Y4DS27_GLUUR|nr:hypothetical protein [Glutamicibacter uratoxydans]GED05311.1 hypothetical protein AUR04nite_08430 [Glutamicibacter uratoxydans]